MSVMVRDKLDDLLLEIGAKNHVEVAVYRGIPHKGGGLRHKRVSHEVVPGRAGGPGALWLADAVRMLAGKPSLYIAEAIRRTGGEILGAFPNLRTNVGVDFCTAQLSGTSVLVADVIALSSSTRSPAATDAATTLPWSTAQTSNTAPVANPNASSGELTYGGFARATAAYAHSVTGPASATTNYVMTKTFTCSVDTTSIQMAGLFGGSAKASQGGTNVTNMLLLESVFTATSLAAATADQLAISWTVSV